MYPSHRKRRVSGENLRNGFFFNVLNYIYNGLHKICHILIHFVTDCSRQFPSLIHTKSPQASVNPCIWGNDKGIKIFYMGIKQLTLPSGVWVLSKVIHCYRKGSPNKEQIQSPKVVAQVNTGVHYTLLFN